MHYGENDIWTMDNDERRFTNVSVKRIKEIEALWRINAERDALVVKEADVPPGPWKLAA